MSPIVHIAAWGSTQTRRGCCPARVNGLVHWLATVLGLNNPAGAAYSFWSGFGADLPIFVGIGVFVRRHNCHAPRCWRLGRHPQQDGAIHCQIHHL